jgi:hypothetical protein
MSLLSVADIAEERHCDNKTALRWLLRLERELGAHLVRQGGRRKLYVERSELARVVALDQGRPDAVFIKKLDAFLERLDELEQRQNGLVREVSELRHAAWMRR